jgi:hypothetical protein
LSKYKIYYSVFNRRWNPRGNKIFSSSVNTWRQLIYSILQNSQFDDFNNWSCKGKKNFTFISFSWIALFTEKHKIRGVIECDNYDNYWKHEITFWWVLIERYKIKGVAVWLKDFWNHDFLNNI